MVIYTLDIPGEKGYYVLVINVVKPLDTIIGSLGRIQFRKGYYLYIGSACGSGGLRARIKRHLRRSKNIHWHIDYLLSCRDVVIEGIMFFTVPDCSVDYESIIARELVSRSFDYVRGFGCSDKRSDLSHLIYCGLDYRDCINALNTIFEKYCLKQIYFIRQI